MTGANDLARMVPGFEFLQGLFKNAGASLPAMGQWVAPTLNPEELEKRIQELKTVQFWLEQNARLLGTTIQALEVQRMTLSTLQTMNLPLAELGEALRIKTPAAPAARPAPAPQTQAEEEPEAADDAEDEPALAARATPAKVPRAAAPPAAAAVDPMQWWGALTQQFTEIAARAVKDSTAEAPHRPDQPAQTPRAAAGARATKAAAPAKGARKRAR